MTISEAYSLDETTFVNNLLTDYPFSAEQEQQTSELAATLINGVRQNNQTASSVESLMSYYDLSTIEGVLLMRIAEALMRIPDRASQQQLITDLITPGNWSRHLGKSNSHLVNWVTRGICLSQKILIEDGWKKNLTQGFIFKIIYQAIKKIGDQFVVGRDIQEALRASQPNLKKGYLYSYDMLGEVARTQKDADHYFRKYQLAIAKVTGASGISVKLSALYPRYQWTHRQQAIPFLTEKLLDLAIQANKANIGLTIDAEEVDRLEMCLEIFAGVFANPVLKNWQGLGLAVQAYQKNALSVLDWLIELSKKYSKRINVRLVKGAYWDTEIKLTQIGSFEQYPVFTRKMNTDLNYLVCAHRMLSVPEAIYSQFATHNAYSAAAIITMAQQRKNKSFEFQRLQGMGQALHDQLLKWGFASRIYGPVGSHEELLPYLVRRLLENGANSSFVNQIAQPQFPIEKLIQSPAMQIKSYSQIAHPKIPLPKNIYGSTRLNSSGINVNNSRQLAALEEKMKPFQDFLWQASPFCRPVEPARAQLIFNPADRSQAVGQVVWASKADVDQALNNAVQAFPDWNKRPVQERADLLLKVADLLEANKAELIALTIREAGKTIEASIAEVREAVDYCRYYSQLALELMTPKKMPGPTGEDNFLRLTGRGPMACISPWNFPIAIFTGQVVAALITGNVVIAKPAEQTPLTADRIVRLFYEAGIPQSVLQCLPGGGETVGAALINDPRIQGVLFTGSTDTAKAIYRSLAERPGPIVPLIAETGGVNAMIADSSALLEQLVNDVISSAFDSAGQRCSALRILFVQHEIADQVMEMLRGAMAELIVGNPNNEYTDVGPVIDQEAQQMLAEHSQKLVQQAKLVFKADLPPETEQGTFIAPQAWELTDLSLAKKEVFGPILHIIRFEQGKLPAVIKSINDLGYGLTFGIQSRIDSHIEYAQKNIQAGNIYVNRNMIGAVVGVQPFGGQGLSGTGPKAGGPHYLTRLCAEATLTINITATGGNPELMSLD